MTLLVTLGFSCGCASPSARLPDGASALDAMFDDAAPPTDASPSTDGHFPLDASIDAGEGACVRACDPHGRCELEAGAALCRCDAGWTGARCDEHAREAYDRVLVSIDLADPAALVLDDGRVLFSGTRGGRTLPLIERFRVYYTSDGAFRHFAHSEYDGHSDDVFIELPGGSRATIPVRWNELQTGAEYSLDVRRTDGTWVAPCQGAAILRGALGHDYAGRCRSAAADVPLEEVSALRVCAAEGGRWDRARCGETKWTATGESADVPIP